MYMYVNMYAHMHIKYGSMYLTVRIAIKCMTYRNMHLNKIKMKNLTQLY